MKPCICYVCVYRRKNDLPEARHRCALIERREYIHPGPTAATQSDATDREIRGLVKAVIALLPNPVSTNQRVRIEEAVHSNLTGLGVGT